MASVDSKDLFEILVRETMDSVRAFLLASVRDPAAADDLVQETYLVAWRTLDRYDRQLPFGPWVRGIAAKLLLNWRRKVARHKVTKHGIRTTLRKVKVRSVFTAVVGVTFDLNQCDLLVGLKDRRHLIEDIETT